jgi:hypothetical protein
MSAILDISSSNSAGLRKLYLAFVGAIPILME